MKKNEAEESLLVGRQKVRLSNQQKLYWPKEKITKGDLVQYYNSIAPVMLPYLKNRPESMHRFPNGITGPSFYQKDVDPKIIPDWLKTQKMYSSSNKAYIDYLVCNDAATLVYMANLGCIEIHPWNSRIATPDNPDWMVIDLDPEAIDFKAVVKTAIEVRRLFEELDITSYCKTSGSTGLHIYVPLAAKYTYDIARSFGELIAHAVHERIPDITSVVRQPKKRQGKVYLDYLQNSRGQTLAAPYSVRPKPGATVSTPLEWSEVTARLDPKKFTIKTIFKRLDSKGDLWSPVLKRGTNIMRALKQLSAYEQE